MLELFFRFRKVIHTFETIFKNQFLVHIFDKEKLVFVD